MDWKKESEMFNQMADYYDKYRPSYPTEIIDTIINCTNISNKSKLLEIGAGSGKATELFAGNEHSILCIEPGEYLVKIGSDKFKHHKNIKFEVGRFEEYPVLKQHYDVIFSAQAFHWIPQPIGYEKCAYALKDNGYLALFWNMYITYDTDSDKDLREISSKYGGFSENLSSDECEKRINFITNEIENSNLFQSPSVTRVFWNKEYTADEYFGFALTGNSFVQKSELEKQKAYEDIKKLALKYNGVINRHYLCVLYLAKKLPI